MKRHASFGGKMMRIVVFPRFALSSWIQRPALRCAKSQSEWYKGTAPVVQRADLRGTEVRASYTRLSCQTYLCQLSKDSASAVKCIFVSCQMYLCQLSKVRVRLFPIFHFCCTFAPKLRIRY